MTYPADPGGNFASDAHRRVCGHIPTPKDDPMSLTDLFIRMVRDEGSEYITDEVQAALVIEDLVTSGLVEKIENGWRQTSDGYDLLNAPVEGGEGS